MAITPAMTGMSGMSGMTGAGEFAPSDFDNLRQWFLDGSGYRSSELNGIPVLESKESHGTYRQPRQGRCYLFDGTDDYVKANAAQPSYPFSIWVRFGSDTPVGTETLVSLAKTGAVTSYFAISHRPADFRITRRNSAVGAINTDISIVGTPYDGNQHELVVVFLSATSFNLYCDGTKTSSTALTSVTIDTIDTLLLGVVRDASPTQFYADNLVRAGWWNSALSDSDVNGLLVNTIPAGVESLHYCNEESGVVAYDASGNGNHGTLTSITQSTFHATDTGATANPANEVGFTPALSFDGTDDQVDLDTQIAETDCSVSMWVRFGTIGLICMSEKDGGGSYIQFQSTTNIRVATESAGQTDDFTVPTMTAGNWYHLVVTKDSTSYRVYLNGTESSSGAATGGSVFNIDTIGGFTGDSFDWEGQIESVQVYDDVLTDNEVTFLYDGTGDDPTSDNLILDLQFDEMTGTIAYDGSGSGNNGTLADDATWHVIPRDESDTDNDVRGAALKFVGKSPFPAQVNVPCVTFDGTNDHIDIGDISASATEISFYVKSLVDNQELFTLQDSTATAVDVASGTLTFGGSLNVTAITVDGVSKTASEAGALLNDNTWHKVVLTLDSISVSDLNLGCDATGGAFGNISLAEFKINTDGADGYWPLQEGGGNICYDVSGNDNHGTITSADLGDVWANTTNDVQDHSINYGGGNAFFPYTTAGTDASVTVTSVPASTVHTIAFWARVDPSSDPLVVYAGGTSFGPQFQSGTQVRYYASASANATWSGLADVDGLYQHYAISRNGTSIRFYINGVDQGEKTLGANDSLGAWSTLIHQVFPLDGIIRDVRWYADTALSTNEILWIASYGASGSEGVATSAITHQWLFDEGAGTTVADNVGSNDGTIVPNDLAVGDLWVFLPAIRDGSGNDVVGRETTKVANKLGNGRAEIDTNPYTAAELNGLGAETDYSLTDTRQDVAPNDTKFRRTDTDGDDRFFTTDEALTGADKTSAEEYVS